MARILFISINDVNAAGIRSMSAVLGQQGHQPHIVFLQRNGFPYNREKRYLAASERVADYDWVGVYKTAEKFRYSRGPEITRREKALLLSLIKEISPDLIGFSVVTPLKRRIAAISQLVRRTFRIPVIWGGPEPTVDPGGCLRYCDIVCRGEGENTIAAIAGAMDAGRDIRGIRNVAYARGVTIIKNPLFPPIRDLDQLPFMDISPVRKYLIDGDAITHHFEEISYSGNYHTSSSRGCILNCSYCCENYFKKLYSPHRFYRRRSPENVINELTSAKKTAAFPGIQFEDEIFSLDYEWLKEFRDRYVRDVGLPFSCNIYPDKDIENKLRILKDAGVTSVALSLQSGSGRINREIFNRGYDRELFLKTAQLIKRMGIRYHTDVITYNPFEEEEDLLATLETISRLPGPFGFCVNKLYVFKNTKISELLGRRRPARKKKGLDEKTFDFYARLFWAAAQGRARGFLRGNRESGARSRKSFPR